MIVSKQTILDLYKKWNVNAKLIPSSNSQWIDAFNALGLEVENVTSNHLREEDFSVVQITAIRNHPDSDHMHICTITDGHFTDEIVCGASNVYVGMYTILAKLNTTMPNGMQILKRKIRGVYSSGMLCSLNELCPIFQPYFSKQDVNGIVDLNVQGNKNVKFDLHAGATNFIDYLMLNDDVFELSISTNAGYLNAIYPIAMALLAYWNIDFHLCKKPMLTQAINTENHFQELGMIAIHCANEENAYYLRMLSVHNFMLADSIAQTYANFLMLFFGVCTLPLKFQATTLTDLQLDLLKQNVDVTLSENEQMHLLTNSVILKQNNRNLAVPGFFVFSDFTVEATDQEFILLYSINDWYHNTQLKRFCNVNSYISTLSTKQTTFQFMNDFLFADWFVPNSLQIHVFTHQQNTDKFIECNQEKLFHKLALHHDYLNQELILKQMRLIGLHYNQQLEGFFVPDYRKDLENENDLIEEALRFINVNLLQPEPITAFLKTDNDTFEFDALNRLRNYLIDLGFFEIKTYKLISKERFQNTTLHFYNADMQTIQNKISSEREVLKHSLIDSLCDVLQTNLNQKNYEFHNLFEMEQLYYTNNEISDFVLGMLITKDFATTNFYQVQNLNEQLLVQFVQNLLQLWTIDDVTMELQKQEETKKYTNYYHIIVNHHVIGFVAMMQRVWNNNFLNQNYPTYALEINLSFLLELMRQKANVQLTYKKLHNVPKVLRDFNVVIALNNNDYWQTLLQLKKQFQIQIPELESLFVKDIYIDQVQNQKTLTLTYILNPKTNWKKEQINQLESEIQKTLTSILHG